MLAGSLDARIASWLSGASLTALRKHTGDFRPFAVGKVLRRIASRICCAAVKDSLPDVFLPYGQVGAGIPDGVEAAAHGLRQYINEFGCRED